MALQGKGALRQADVRGSQKGMPMFPQRTVLVVSEDAALIHSAGEALRSKDVRVIGCLGPAHSRCELEDRGSCPLAAKASLVLIEPPPRGIFRHHWKVVPAGTYAEALQKAHPSSTVILCGTAEGEAGPSGDVTHSSSARSLLALVRATPYG